MPSISPALMFANIIKIAFLIKNCRFIFDLLNKNSSFASQIVISLRILGNQGLKECRMSFPWLTGGMYRLGMANTG
jgi:hypothetical protein